SSHKASGMRQPSSLTTNPIIFLANLPQILCRFNPPTEIGSKGLLITNWQQRDEQSALWCKMTAVARTEEEWAKFFLTANAHSSVPRELADMLEVARAAMMYSWYF